MTRHALRGALFPFNPSMKEISMKSFLTLAFFVLAASTAAHAQTPAPESAQAPAAVVSSPLSEGEVRKVDKEASKLTLKHGPLVSLDMPAMTMVFRVSNPAFLDAVKQGDKVRFSVEKMGGQFTVTHIEVAK